MIVLNEKIQVFEVKHSFMCMENFQNYGYGRIIIRDRERECVCVCELMVFAVDFFETLFPFFSEHPKHFQKLRPQLQSWLRFSFF